VSNDRLQHILTLGMSVPPAGSARLTRLRFVRDYQLRWLPITLLLLIIVAIAGIEWATILCAVSAGLLVLDAAWLTGQVRRLDER
jgi:hypothetical protein